MRYVALLWDEDNPEARMHASRLTGCAKNRFPCAPAYEQPGLVVLCHPPQSFRTERLPLANGCGVILGTMFRQRTDCSSEDCTAVTRLGPSESLALVGSDGRSAFSNYWGSYILFLRNFNQKQVLAARSPMADLACFHMRLGQVHLLFSNVEDASALYPRGLSINWDCICAQATSVDYMTHETAILEIDAVEPGECVVMSRGRYSRRPYWTPRKVLDAGELDNFDTAARTLRSMTRKSVHALASRHRCILQTLSGGFDSSVVLSCLAPMFDRTQVICVNDYSRGTGDERSFASSMAKRYGVELIQRERNPDVDFRMFLQCGLTARPVLNLSACHTEPANAKLARDRGATAIFNGELGDNVFGRSLHSEIVGEYLQQRGLRLEAFHVAMDFSRLARISVWRAARFGLRDGPLRRRKKFWSMYGYARQKLAYDPWKSTLISTEALASYERMQPRFVHPWLRDIDNVPVGKLLLISALTLIKSTTYHSPFLTSDDPPKIAPLSSQPVVETALRIPSYLHIRGAKSRAVARRAFGTDLTELVLARGAHAKGSPDLWIRDAVARNRTFMRELLLDGILIKERIIDRQKTTLALSSEMKSSKTLVNDLIAKLYIEAWLRRWTESRRECAA